MSIDADKLARWLASGDTGISSETIALRMCGIPSGRTPVALSHPRDADDFGRCWRLLEFYPDWRARFANVMRPASPSWAALVERWDEIAAAYWRDAAIPANQRRETYQLMRSILGPVEDAQRQARATAPAPATPSASAEDR